LNRANHIAAVTQLRHDAIRALKRRISDAVYKRLIADTNNQ